MLEAVLIVLALIISFTEKPHLFKKPVSLGKIVIIILLIGSAVFSVIKDYRTDKQQGKAADEIDSLTRQNSKLLSKADSLKRQVSDLNLANEIIHLKFQDSMTAHYKNEVKTIQQTAYNMTEIFAKNSKSELEQHLKTQSLVGKIDTSKLAPADIELLPQPHNVLAFTCDSSGLSGSVYIENMGGRPAYQLSIEEYVIVKANNEYFKLGSPSHGKYNTMAATVVKKLDFGFTGIDCKLITDVYVFIKGKYFKDESLKTASIIDLAVSKNKQSGTIASWNFELPTMDFINKATLIPVNEPKN